MDREQIIVKEGSVELGLWQYGDAVVAIDVVNTGDTAKLNNVDVIEPELVSFAGAVWVTRATFATSDVTRSYGGGGEKI